MALDRGKLAKIDRRVFAEVDHGEGLQMVKIPLSDAAWSTWHRYCDVLGLTMGTGYWMRTWAWARHRATSTPPRLTPAPCNMSSTLSGTGSCHPLRQRHSERDSWPSSSMTASWSVSRGNRPLARPFPPPLSCASVLRHPQQETSKTTVICLWFRHRSQRTLPDGLDLSLHTSSLVRSLQPSARS